MNPLVSIIIPIYNVEKYIERCINSVLNQTYRNLELILVDDCSPDNSISLAKQIIDASGKSIDLSCKFLRHEINCGQSAARNTGMRVATGDYVFFLDSDDEITEDCIEVLARPLLNYTYDIVMAGYMKGEEIIACSNDKIINNRNEIIWFFAQGAMHAMPWNKLCNINFLKKNGLGFREGVLHEDVLWNFQVACKASAICCLKKPTYIYYIYNNSSSRAAEKLQKRLNSLEIVFREMYQFQFSQNSYNIIVDTAIRQFFPLYEDTMRQLPYFSLWNFYTKIRNADCRNRRQKKMVYNTLARKLRYLDYFLPIPLGFAYRYLCWTLVKLKAKRNDIPFVY